MNFTDRIFKETSIKAVRNMVAESSMFSKWNALQGRIRPGTRGGNVFFPEVPVNVGEDESLLESSAASSRLWTVVIYLSCLLLLVLFDIFPIWYVEKNSMKHHYCRLRIKTSNLKRELSVLYFFFCFGKLVFGKTVLEWGDQTYLPHFMPPLANLTKFTKGYYSSVPQILTKYLLWGIQWRIRGRWHCWFDWNTKYM